jgi:hypothetical protein
VSIRRLRAPQRGRRVRAVLPGDEQQQGLRVVGAPVVALWLLGIIVNLLLIPGYYDVALRDFGLLLAALALARLAAAYDTRTLTARRR